MSDYLTFWKVDTAVFLRSVGPREIFVPEHLTSSLERLKLFCTSEPRTLLLITGATGTGKSTLLRWLASEIPVATHELLILSLIYEEWHAGWLSPRLAEMLGAPEQSGDLDQSIWEVAHRLDELVLEQKHILIALDSAHLAKSPEALSEILAFLNIQALSVPCLTFILCGEPDILPTIQHVPGLLSKIALHVRLAPLSLEATHAYMAHRMRLAGLANPFDAQAVAWIHQRAQGILSTIDIHAEHCLIEASQLGLYTITEEIARSAAQHFLLPQDHNESRDIPVHAPVTASDMDSDSVAPWTPPTKQKGPGRRKSPAKRRSTALKEEASSEEATGPDLEVDTTPALEEPLPSPHQPDTPKLEPSPDPIPGPSQENKAEDAGSASIRLSSLFKLTPGRSKPKGP